MAAAETQRQLKVARLLQRDLAEIFQRDMTHILQGAFVTVTTVNISADLSVANAYLSFMLAKDTVKLMGIIEENNKQIRTLLGAKVRHQLRIVPHLRFFHDTIPDDAMRMDQLLASLNIPKEDGTTDTEETGEK
jgi:ribosome-binding factor A